MKKNRIFNRPKTAADLMAELQRDPAYQEKLHQRHEQQLHNVERYNQAAEPLLSALERAGLRVGTIAELRIDLSKLKAAIPILLEWLPIISDPSVKEDVVRSLSVPYAKPVAAEALIREFIHATDPSETGLRWAVANALEVVADESVFEEVVRLATDRQYGKAREMLVLALGNMSDERAIPVLVALLQDDELVGHAVIALGKLKASNMGGHIEPLLRPPKEWVRDEARKALSKINLKY